MAVTQRHAPRAVRLHASKSLWPSRLTPSAAAGLLTAPGADTSWAGGHAGGALVPGRDASDGGGRGPRAVPRRVCGPSCRGSLPPRSLERKRRPSTGDPLAEAPHRCQMRGTLRGTFHGRTHHARVAYDGQAHAAGQALAQAGRWPWSRPSVVASTRVAPFSPCGHGGRVSWTSWP